MKDLGKKNIVLACRSNIVQMVSLSINQRIQRKVLKRFYMDKSHPLSSSIVVLSLEVTKDPFRPKDENE